MKPWFLVLILTITGVVVFSPVPFVFKDQFLCMPCSPDLSESECPRCPQKGEIGWKPSLFMTIRGRLSGQINNSTLSVERVLEWKTYTNEKYGFLFKFPPEDQVVESANNVALMNIPFMVEVGDLRTEFSRNYLGLSVKSTRVIGEMEWEVLFKEDMGPESGGEATYYQTIHGDFRYVVGYTFSNSDLLKIDQILSTFKFLN